MAEPSLFRHYQIVQDAEGNNVELIRSTEQVTVLAFDNERLEFVHCHVLLEPLKNKAAFDEAARALQHGGHPLIASVVDYGEDDGNPFYINSNVDGETLRGYLQRQTELPLWLAAMLTTRSLEAAIAMADRGDWLTDQPLDSLRVVQTGASSLSVMVSDFRLNDNGTRSKSRLLKSNFERQAKFMRAFLAEQGGGSGPTLPDSMLSAADFAELLGGTLASGGPGLTSLMLELRNALLKLVPEHLASEIPTAQKPRALVAPLLASYQEVARGVVNLVRIQSQRLDMANPYAMRGTHTRTGRAVLVEQVPPSRLCGARVLELDKAVQNVGRKRDITALLPLPLVNDGDGLACMAEAVAEGLALSEILRERKSLAVAEVYLVLAGADAALGQLERSGVETRKLRLEDIFLLTGFGRDDARTARLLESRLNEWPSFTVLLRAHPTLAAMAGRGTNVASELPPLAGKAAAWNGGWLACLGKQLAGTEGVINDSTRETIMRLFEDEIVKARDGIATGRSDLLARFARVIQHYDLVAPTPITTVPAEPMKPKATVISPKQALPLAEERESALPALPGSAVSPLFTQSALGVDEDDSVGFAELLFQGAAGQKTASATWGKGASEGFDSGQVGGWGADTVDLSPWWLKATVFLGGSMVAGAFLAQMSGHALWQLHPPMPGKSAPAAASKATVQPKR